MSKLGGARAGAGRKPGSPNRRTVEVLEGALANGQTPVEYMLAILRDETADTADRRWAAEKAAPYIHPRPAPLQRAVTIDLPDLDKASDLAAVTLAIVKATASGQISPAEAQQLSSVIETHRKAIETSELVNRIEQLEAKSAKK